MKYHTARFRRVGILRYFCAVMLVFDLDDTLYKEVDFVKSSYLAIAAVLSERGLMSADEVVELLGSPFDMGAGIDRLVARLMAVAPECGIEARNIVEIYRTHTPVITLTQQVEKTLAFLKEQNTCMGLITDGRSVTQRAKIRALGLHRFFDESDILISEEIGADKHSRIPFELMMERHPEQLGFAYVGDNPAKDFLWPNRLGWMTIMLAGDHANLKPQHIELPKEYMAGFRISSFGGVVPLCGLPSV